MRIEREINIKYWWDVDGVIDSGHVEALEETAIERIQKMMVEGYNQGELRDNIRMHDSDPEDGIIYHGWWEVTTSRKP